MRLPTVVAAVSLAASLFAQGRSSSAELASGFAGSGLTSSAAPRCTAPSSLGPGVGIDNPDCDFFQTNPSNTYAPIALLRVPVVVHVITNTAGQGYLSDAVVQSQLQVLNEDYRALPGTPGAAGTDTRIEFFLATSDPTGQPTTGIVRHQNDSWFDDQGDYWTPTAWPTQRYLNIYTNTAQGFGAGALGYTVMPQSPVWINTPADRVVIQWSVFGRPAVVPGPFAQGRVCTHEVGHWFGLFHTFDFGCDLGSCHNSGDRICDTNPEAGANTGCPTNAISCGVPAPVHNYMDFTDDACMTGFTPEQARRMRCTLTSYRSQLAQVVGPSASATPRNGLGNRNGSYTITPPHLGQLCTAQVTTAGTSMSLATVFGYSAPAYVPFEGNTILIDTASAYVFQMQFALDPNAVTWSFTVPNLLVLSGLTVNTQAVMIGNGFALTNAVDFVVGN